MKIARYIIAALAIISSLPLYYFGIGFLGIGRGNWQFGAILLVMGSVAAFPGVYALMVRNTRHPKTVLAVLVGALAFGTWSIWALLDGLTQL